MFCPKCGTEVITGANNCHVCGASVQNTQQPNPAPAYDPNFQPNALPMKWYKFLIYFALFASAVLNGYNAISMFLGLQYGSDADTVYAVFNGLKPLDMIIGIISLGIAIFALYVRSRLAGYYADGPKMLLYLYAATIISNIVYYAGLWLVLPSDVMDQIGSTSTVTSVIVSVIMIGVNTKYFENRKHLFTK